MEKWNGYTDKKLILNSASMSFQSEGKARIFLSRFLFFSLTPKLSLSISQTLLYVEQITAVEFPRVT